MDGESNSTSISSGQPKDRQNTEKKQNLMIEGYPIEGISVAGQETCVIFPSLNIAFDIGRCPQSAVFQDFVFISHGHVDHIGGLLLYVEERENCSLKPPTIFIPNCLKENVERLFERYREIKQSELKHNLIVLNIGEEYQINKDLKVKAFNTYHRVPSQGYLIYKVEQELKKEFVGLSEQEISQQIELLKLSGEEITNTKYTPEIAFTGDTMSDFILEPNNSDVLKSRILVMECTYINDAKSVEEARERGHTHLSEISKLSDRLLNKAILLIHFSPRYRFEEIEVAISKMPPCFTSRVFALKGNTEKKKNLSIEGHSIERISLEGQKTCLIFPSLKLGFNIGRCPQSVVSQDFVFISHEDHIGGLPIYVAARESNIMKPPTIFVPNSLKEKVERLLEVYSDIIQIELKHNLIGLNIDEEYQIRKDLKVKAFRTSHLITSQGYLIYTVKQKFKQKYAGYSGKELKELRQSGVEITETITTPEIAFIGNTTSDFITDENDSEVLKSRILVMEEIEEATSKMPSSFTGRILSLTDGI